MHLSELLTLSDSALKRASKYPSRRALFTHLSSMKGKHYVGIVGPRGAGKTILLLQLALEMEDCFYLSLDTLDKEADLFGLIERLVGEYKFQNFFLDEIHFHKNPTGFLLEIGGAVNTV
jgi:predicted AAA+ superfamily ATPase